MDFFFYIISTHTGIKIKFEFNFEPKPTQDIMIFSLVCSIKNELSKFIALKKTVINALFISQETRNMLLDIFSKNQKYYWTFKNFFRKIHLKTFKKFNVDYDLYMNPLSDIPKHLLVDIYDKDNSTIYSFRISDLISIINNCLTNSYEFFAEPLKPRNPYTNINFTKAQLYHIYFSIRNTNIVLPALIHQYFLCNFNLKQFKIHNESAIIDTVIYKFITNSTRSEKLFHVHEMTYEYNDILQIHNDFPSELLYKNLSNLLKNYLFSKYSSSPTLKFQSKQLIKDKLIKFKKEKPLFGRKIIQNNVESFISF